MPVPPMPRVATTIACLVMLAVQLAPAAPAAVYYVAVDGSDGNVGTAQWPMQKIGAAALRAHAGDLVVVRAGTYSEAVTLTRSGESAAPIVFRGLPGAVMASPDRADSLSAFDIGSDVSFITVQGFEMAGGFAETVFVRPRAHHVELAGLHIHHNRSGIWIAGASDVRVRDCVIDHNYRTGIRIYSGAHHVEVIDTRSAANDDGSGCAGDSDGFNADPSTSDIIFERASAIGNSEDGFDLQGPNVTLLQVTAQDNNCSGIKIAAGGYLENALIERSRIGINTSAPAGATTAIENCTVSENGIGVRVGGSGHTLVLRNSIVTGPGKALTFPSAAAIYEDHNILHRPLAKDRLIVRQSTGGDAMYSGDDINGGMWRRESGQGDGTVAGDPDFAARSCRPRGESVAIDSGSDMTAPPLDLAGTPRPVGAGVDRGAFEWVPAPPALYVADATVYIRATGTGQVRLRAEMPTVDPISFNPLTDPVDIAFRTARGDLVRVHVPAGGGRVSRVRDGTLLRFPHFAAPGRSVRLTLRVSADRVSLRLSARRAETWPFDGGPVTLTVALGQLYASAEVRPRVSGAVS